MIICLSPPWKRWTVSASILRLRFSSFTIFCIRFICDLPWDKTAQDTLDLAKAKEILDKNHHGLEPIKERILEILE